MDNGLSANFVFCIMQDAKGFMWFGTKDGLNKFDGNSFKVFRHNPRKENPHSGKCGNARYIGLMDIRIPWCGEDS